MYQRHPHDSDQNNATKASTAERALSYDHHVDTWV